MDTKTNMRNSCKYQKKKKKKKIFKIKTRRTG